MTDQETTLIQALTNDAIADFKRGKISAFQVETTESSIYFKITKFSPLLGEDKQPYARSGIERKSIKTSWPLPYVRKQAHTFYRDVLKQRLEETYLLAVREQNVIAHPDESSFIIRPDGGKA
jgi:hypothetical protein